MNPEVQVLFDRGEVTVDVDNGCILWGRAKSGNGYGSAWDHEARRVRSAHVVSWELANGRPVPKGMVVMHSCDVKLCINPDHLSVGTYSQNMLDAIERGLAAPGSYQLAKETCPSNHPYVEENIYYRSNGERICKTCVKDRKKGKAAR